MVTVQSAACKWFIAPVACVAVMYLAMQTLSASFQSISSPPPSPRPVLPMSAASRALFYAIEHSDMPAFHAALAQGADVFARDSRDRCSPLVVAAMNGEVRMVDTLLARGADVSQRCQSGYDALHVATVGQHIPVVHRLLQAGASPLSLAPDHFTPIHRAVLMKDVSRSVELLRTLLDFAGRQSAWRESVQSTEMRHKKSLATPLHSAVTKKNREALTLLVAHRLHVNVVDAEGLTALHRAVTSADAEAVRILLTHPQVDVNVLTGPGPLRLLTALDLAWHEGSEGQPATYHRIAAMLKARGALSAAEVKARQLQAANGGPTVHDRESASTQSTAGAAVSSLMRTTAQLLTSFGSLIF